MLTWALHFLFVFWTDAASKTQCCYILLCYLYFLVNAIFYQMKKWFSLSLFYFLEKMFSWGNDFFYFLLLFDALFMLWCCDWVWALTFKICIHNDWMSFHNQVKNAHFTFPFYVRICKINSNTLKTFCLCFCLHPKKKLINNTLSIFNFQISFDHFFFILMIFCLLNL